MTEFKRRLMVTMYANHIEGAPAPAQLALQLKDWRQEVLPETERSGAILFARSISPIREEDEDDEDDDDEDGGSATKRSRMSRIGSQMSDRSGIPVRVQVAGWVPPILEEQWSSTERSMKSGGGGLSRGGSQEEGQAPAYRAVASQVLVLREGPALTTPVLGKLPKDSEAYVLEVVEWHHGTRRALITATARTAQPLGWVTEYKNGHELLVRCEPNEIEMEGSTYRSSPPGSPTGGGKAKPPAFYSSLPQAWMIAREKSQGSHRGLRKPASRAVLAAPVKKVKRTRPTPPTPTQLALEVRL